MVAYKDELKIKKVIYKLTFHPLPTNRLQQKNQEGKVKTIKDNGGRCCIKVKRRGNGLHYD